MSEPTTEILDANTASALFANMVLQQTNLTLIFLGQAPHPETGETMHDLQTAKVLIDQLEMIAMKTKGNLNAQESALMNRSLAAVRMAFVEAVEHGAKSSAKEAPSSPLKGGEGEQPKPADAASASSTAESATAASSGTESSAPTSAEDDETRKKFSKKY